QLGFATTLRSGITTGLYGSWTRGDGDFAEDAGSLQFDSYALTAFAGMESGPFSAALTASVGKSYFTDISRRVVLGPAVRTEQGQTDGSFGAVEARASYGFAAGAMKIAPFATARYDRVTIDGYAE